MRPDYSRSQRKFNKKSRTNVHVVSRAMPGLNESKRAAAMSTITLDSRSRPHPFLHAIPIGLMFATLLAAAGFSDGNSFGGSLPRSAWGAPNVTVSQANGEWQITGQKHLVFLKASNLAIRVEAGPAEWNMVPSSPHDMIVKSGGRQFHLRLADAKKIQIVRYDTGFKTGVKITLSDWRHGLFGNRAPGLVLYLTVCLEGGSEDLVFGVAAKEGNAVLRQLDWPTALDARDVDYTILSNARGNLLPRDWPKAYSPIRHITPDGKVDPKDHSVLQSHVIEDWSMSWWGFQKGKSAMMVIIQTPNDAAYQFSHPAGGPTVIGPRWRATLGRFGYMRSARMCFFAHGNYVTLAKRYRQYVKDTGLFVSLKEKIARTPELAKLIGTPQTRVGILRNRNKSSDRYDTAHPENNHSLTTFDERAKQLRDLKARGIDRTLVLVSGWPHLGYDRQHPDPLPPPESAGGWAGMKRLADTCRELGYPLIFHDQYRDYYTDAPGFDRQFAIHKETTNEPATAFPGSRFGDWKEGAIPFMRHWDGGVQTYLNARFMSGNLERNYRLFFEHGIHPQGIYLDVFGYVPPDQDFNPEHPTTRSDAMRAIARCFNWSREHLGVVSTEAGSDWVIPYVDSVNQSGGTGKCIPVPLYNLVYHDAVLISYGEDRNGGVNNLLKGILCGGVPELPVGETNPKSLALITEMGELNKRVALVEMTNLEFLDKDRRRERSTFADGTTVTVDRDAQTVSINPPLQ